MKIIMKKIYGLVSILLVIAMIFTGCSNANVKNSNTKGNTSEKSTVKSISISYVKLPLNVPSIVEKKLNLFQKEFEKDNIKINIPEITEGPKMTEAMASGSLDFANALGGTSAILAAANGVDLKIIGIYSRAPKTFTIMTKENNIKSVADLKGKKVGGPKGTILHQLLLSALKKNNMNINDVNYINMGIPDAVSAMDSGKIDAALVAGPAVPQSVKAGAHILTTGEGLLDATIVIAVSGKFLKEHPDLVSRYMKVHEESLKYMKEHPEEVYKMTEDETGLSENDVKNMYGLYDFNPKITSKDIKDLEDTQTFLKDNNMLTKTIDIKSLIVNVKY